MLRPILEKALNAWLQGDPLAPLYLNKLAGKTLEIRVRGLAINLYLFFKIDCIKVATAINSHCPADAIISGTPLTLLRASKTPHAGTSQLDITGDLALIQIVQTWLIESAIDWEAYLSRWLGDVLAHEIAKQIRHFQQHCQTSIASLTQNCTEYLQEEYQQLPSRLEVEEFLTEVAVINDDVERFTLRCQQVQALFNTAFKLAKEVQ